MTRSQLITTVSKKTGLSAAHVEKVLNETFGSIIVGLAKGEKVTIAGFGRFEMRERRTKSYVNPKTKEPCQLAPTAIPGFKASGIMKAKLNSKK